LTVSEYSENAADGADHRVIPINENYRFLRIVVGDSRTVIWLVEKRIRHGVPEWSFVANERSQWRRPPVVGSAADARS